MNRSGAELAGRTVEATGDEPRAPARPGVVGVAIVVVCVVTGVAVRIWIMSGTLGTIDSDAAITGLMARHLLQGHFSAFMWRLNYHGTITVFPVALSLRVFGMTSRFALELPYAFISAGSAILVWRIGTRFLKPFQAAFAGLTLWLWPALFVWLGVYPYLAYVATLCLGLAMMLCAQRAVERPERVVDWCLVGLFAGLGFWNSPNINYFVIPVAIWLVVYHRHVLWARVLLVVPFAVLGALPWIWNNFSYGFDSLSTPAGSARGTYLDHLGYAFTHALPAALGLRGFIDGTWILGSAGWVLYAGALLALGFGVWKGLGAQSPAAIGMLTCPFVFALVPFASNLENDFIGNGRYFFFFAPFLVLTIAYLARPVAAAVVVAVLLAVSSLWGFSRLYHYRDAIGAATPLDGVVRVLERGGHHEVFSSFWISSRLTFESGEDVVAVATDLGPTLQAFEDRVRDAPLPVYVLSRDDENGLEDLRRRANEAGVALSERPIDSYVIVVPSKKLTQGPARDVSQRP